MRYAIYAVLVLIGIGGLLLGMNAIVIPQTEAQGILFILIGTVALSGLGVVMAIEAASKAQSAKLDMLVRLAGNVEKRATIADQAAAEKSE